MATADLQTHCRLTEPRSQVVWLHLDRLLVQVTRTQIGVILRVPQHGTRAKEIHTRRVDQSASMTVTLTCQYHLNHQSMTKCTSMHAQAAELAQQEPIGQRS